jgi:hypothetical protein
VIAEAYARALVAPGELRPHPRRRGAPALAAALADAPRMTRSHADRFAFERDRRKDAALRTHGVTPLRVTDAMLADTPFMVVTDLVRALHFLK